MRKAMYSMALFSGLALIISCSSGTGSGNLEQQITGTYAAQSENEFDLIKDTIEIKRNDQGKYDVVQTRWSSAKQDDPQRPVNKIAGQWNNNSGSKTLVAEFQKSDTTLRITEQITGRLKVISFDLANGKLINHSLKGTESIYERVK